MKIAVATEEESPTAQIAERFGRAKFFLVFDGAGNLLEVIRNDPPSEARGVGHHAAQILVDAGATHAVAVRFGPEAGADLADAGIEFFEHRGIAQDAVNALS